jgi:hypothetical protein
LLNAGAFASTPLAGTIGGGAALVIPQFAMAGGWATETALINQGNAAISGRIDIFDQSGNPMAVKMNGVNQSTFLYSIPASGVFMLAPRDANGQTPF